MRNETGRRRARPSGRPGAHPAAALALAPVPSEAIAPAPLPLAKQIATNVAESMLKDAILSEPRGDGAARGSAPQRAGAVDRGAAAAVVRRQPAPRDAGGGADPACGTPGTPGKRTGRRRRHEAGCRRRPRPRPRRDARRTRRHSRRRRRLPWRWPAKMACLRRRGQLPAGVGLDPDQMAMLAESASRRWPSRCRPRNDRHHRRARRAGFLPKLIQREPKECMVARADDRRRSRHGTGRQADAPKLRQARAERHALSPGNRTRSWRARPGNRAVAGRAARQFCRAAGSGYFRRGSTRA